MQKYFLILLMPLLLVSCKTMGQHHKEYTTDKKRAIRKYESALESFEKYRYAEAKEDLRKAAGIDEEFVEPWLLLAEIHLEQKKDTLAAKAFQKAISIKPMFFPPAHFNLGKLYLKFGDYDQALERFKFYEKYGRDEGILKKNRRYLDNAKFAIESMKNPVPFDPENMGANINSESDEWINATTVDESFIIFTVFHKVKTPQGERKTEDFYFSRKDEQGNWQPRQPMSKLFNTPNEEGAMFISPDNSFLVFSGCNRPDGFGSCDLYISLRRGSEWSKPQNMGNRVNSRAWDTHPTIASDNKTIYFISTRKGGYGGADVWKTVLQEDGTWSQPENLGPEINTPQDELYPFVHFDNQTLYFTSSGHTGMGGMDFFVARKQADGWSKPENLGYPINTSGNELGLQVNAAGNLAFISTDHLEGHGGFDIYSFDLPEEHQPTPVTYMKGIVYDHNTKQKLQAEFELIDLKTEEVIATSFSDMQSGAFLLSIPANRDYALNVKRPGYLFFSDNFSLEGVHSKTDPYIKDIPLKPIKVGETVVLRNIFFEYDEYALLPKSKVELKRLVNLLKNNPELNIRIQGHTDSRGDEQYNLELSEKRAESVYDYLVERGIDKKRLSYKGYGESQPVATNETEEGRAENRRTEFVVVKGDK